MRLITSGATPRRLSVFLAMVGMVVALLCPAPAAQAAALGPFSCMPVNGLSSRYTNPPDDLMRGIVVITGYSAVNVGTGTINWGLDPFKDASWRKLFLSLKWVESLTDAYTRTGNTAYLTRARAIGQDFAAHVPAGGGAFPADAWNGMYAGQRATVFSCLESKGGAATWITTAMTTHGTWLAANDPGDWNQGVDTAIGLLSSACRTGNTTWAGLADTRFTRMSTATIDEQGAVTEQAPGYGSYLYRRWLAAVAKLQECGRAVPSALAVRLPLLRDFIAWATTPGGTVEQLGDTQVAAAEAAGASDALGYAVSGGAQGTAPDAITKIYPGGYALGRSSWSPFGTSLYWTARFGPGRNYHGHEDHTSLTLQALGNPLVVDSGHIGYSTSTVYRDYLLGPWAHNTVVASGATFVNRSATTLTRSSSGPGWVYLDMANTAWDSRIHKRRVLIDTERNTVIVLDTMSRATAGSWWQLWHLPVGARVTVSGRSMVAMTTADGRARLNLQQVPVPGQVIPAGSVAVISGSTSPYLGWVSRTQNERVAAPVVIFSRVDRTATTLTVLSAGGPASTMSASVRAAGSFAAVDVTVDGRLTTYSISGGGSIYR